MRDWGELAAPRDRQRTQGILSTGCPTAPRHRRTEWASAGSDSPVGTAEQLRSLPEGVEGAHVQHGEQLCFGFGEGQAVVQGLECRHDESCLPLGQLQLLDGVPTAVGGV